MKKNIVILTGAGVSAESGINTFRDSDGLWEGHDVMEVASPEGFRKNPTLVLDFYNQRCRQLLQAKPNAAHYALKALEDHFEVTIITQNVDDLHERAGSTNVIHLHGELLKVKSTQNDSCVLDWTTDLNLGNFCPEGYQLRPHIVWFGEEVPEMHRAVLITKKADILIIIGTSMQVYPAASLIDFVKPETPIYFIDPKPAIKSSFSGKLNVIVKTAVEGVPSLVDKLKATFV